MEVAEHRDPLRTARVIAVGVLTAEVVVLALTGLWLVFFYRPPASSGWTSIEGLHRYGGVGIARGVHRLAAFVSLPTALVAGVLVLVDERTKRAGSPEGRLAFVTAPALVLLVLAASFTGYLLPWDQLALWAVTVGTNMQG